MNAYFSAFPWAKEDVAFFKDVFLHFQGGDFSSFGN